MLHCTNRIAAAVALIVVGVFAGPATADDAVTCQNGPLDVAIPACTREIESGRDSELVLGLLYCIRASRYQEKGDLDAALADYTQSIRLSPNDLACRINRGIVYIGKADFDRAIADFNEAIRLDDVIAARNKANNVAIDTTERALILRDRANTYWSKKDYSDAMADFDQAIQLDPKNAKGNAKALVNRGYMKKEMGDVAGGDADIKAGAAMDPSMR